MPCVACNDIRLWGWTHKKANAKRIEAAMWFYRRLPRVKWPTREITKAYLGIKRTLLPLVTQRMLKYLCHTMRNPNTVLLKISIQGKIPSKRSKGKPSASLLNIIIQSSDQKLHEVSNNCLNRVMAKINCLPRWTKLYPRTACGLCELIHICPCCAFIYYGSIHLIWQLFIIFKLLLSPLDYHLVHMTSFSW